MTFKTLFAIAAIAVTPMSHAAYVTIDEAGMDAVYSQASFGSMSVDIRIGAITTLTMPSLLNIDTDAKVNTLFSQHVGASNVVDFYYVDTVDSCGGFNTSIIGCGEVGGNNFVVESIWAANTTVPTGGNISYGVQLLSHELGHNLGLGHRSGNDLMNSFINGFMDLNASEVSTILSSPLVQTDSTGQRFIQIDPVLVQATVTVVPEPGTFALLSLGLLATVWVSRRAQNER
ncbi:PEP-CTERM sorting domain-containing protein [Roseateles koreensis]|uniref:PEP-CTERM sorting domain-containing protein n=1 Tax=Roseateles koreensis TaxID=2987526 RepID=A0ABT5KXK5_9BURK|nr:PEP-CTERM sorting domain-containing protein [Roseateles koreensis]MDC8786487.1 PEP-CTERM sorting domain-containing protein [Roseateles koreensis]